MDVLDAFQLTVSEASRLIHRNELSPVELLDSLLSRIDRIEPRLKAWVTIRREEAIAVAHECTKEAETGRFRGPLHGIPIGLKDIFYTAGMKTTSGSKILADFVPSYDATVAARLKSAGAIILGKTEATEFGYGDPAPTRNPWNVDHTPGGSSSGSAAGVSSGMCPAALGTQIGGSIIRPAAYCGIVGLKPSQGRISCYGTFPRRWETDHVGILTRSVEDSALLLEVLAGHDLNDRGTTTIPVPPYTAALSRLAPPTLGLLKEFFHERAEKEAKENIDKIVKQLTDAGARVLETKLPRTFRAIAPAHKVVQISELAAGLKDIFETRMMDIRPMTRGGVAAGLLIPASSYIKAQRIRTQAIHEMASCLEQFDCFLTPSTTGPAPNGLENTGDASFNAPWSFCGFPAITVPSGLSRDGLPMGIQLVGRPYDEERVLAAAQWCERIIGFPKKPHEPD